MCSMRPAAQWVRRCLEATGFEAQRFGGSSPPWSAFLAFIWCSMPLEKSPNLPNGTRCSAPALVAILAALSLGPLPPAALSCSLTRPQPKAANGQPKHLGLPATEEEETLSGESIALTGTPRETSSLRVDYLAAAGQRLSCLAMAESVSNRVVRQQKPTSLPTSHTWRWGLLFFLSRESAGTGR